MGACLAALAAQPEARSSGLDVVVVLDACRDRTADVVARAPAALRIHAVTGPAAGPGPARRLGLRLARELVGPGGVLLSTDADTRVAPDWLAAQRAAFASGAQAVGGRILLDDAEAAGLAPGVVAARCSAAVGRLAAVRRFAPDAEHHHFSGASLALTAAAYDRVGGLPDVETLEDEALERALRAAGIPIRYLEAVRVRTSARVDGRARRGLADALAAWEAAARGAADAIPAPAVPDPGAARAA